MAGEWIDVAERIPTYGSRVLVQGILVRVGTLESTDKQGHKWHLEGGKEGMIVARDVRYWMPLPS